MRVKTVILLTICLCVLIGCSSTKETVPPSETTISSDTVEENTTEKLNGNDGIPDIVLQEAETWVVETYENYKIAADQYDFENYFIDWRLTSLEHCYTYENLCGMTLQVFRINFEFLFNSPENVTLIGGMSMTEDGWAVPDYPNSRYLVFQQDGESLVLVTRMVENDCEPDDETFTSDLEYKIEEGRGTFKEYPAAD